MGPSRSDPPREPTGREDSFFSSEDFVKLLSFFLWKNVNRLDGNSGVGASLSSNILQKSLCFPPKETQCHSWWDSLRYLARFSKGLNVFTSACSFLHLF